MRPFQAGYRFSVHIDKHIPHAAGLGGGSSNAAAALLAACRAFGIESEDERVLTVATRLGADVPFFLRGGCALEAIAATCSNVLSRP